MFKSLRFWPGFTGLVRYGNWPFLAIAVAFGLTIDVILTLNFYWTEYITTSQRNVLLVAFLVLYATLAGISRQLVRHIETVRSTDAKGDGFREAIQHYLRGNWFETQCCLNILLKKNPHDAEALLMMATLLRHIKRYDEAAEVLNQLERIQESAAWQIELYTEKQALAQYLSEAK